MSWLIEISDLAAMTKSTPALIQKIAGRDSGPHLSWISGRGAVITRADLPRWRRAISADMAPDGE